MLRKPENVQAGVACLTYIRHGSSHVIRSLTLSRDRSASVTRRASNLATAVNFSALLPQPWLRKQHRAIVPTRTMVLVSLFVTSPDTHSERRLDTSLTVQALKVDPFPPATRPVVPS
jgi:hypothetical protein